MAWTDVLPWNWGGTPHLENLSSADQMYRDRLTKWSQTSAFPHWGPGDLRTALDAISGWYDPARKGTASRPGGTRMVSTADQYWGHVASWWISPDALYLTISPEQRSRIVASVKQSADSAEAYVIARNPATHLPEGGKWPEVPWWVYGVGALVVWNTIRK